MLAATQRILTCITAHQAAFKAGILHRDISASNIMIVDSAHSGEISQGGMLIDWDLSKVIGPGTPDPMRQLTRTVSKVSDVASIPSS